VAVVVPTGAPNVKKIEIVACESLGNVFSDWFLITTLDKSQLNILDNTLYTYRFYNDQAYNYVDASETNQPYDFIPQEANAQELLNGNVLAYGGILEGYDQIVSNAAATSDVNKDLKTTQYPFVFVGNQSGNSGFGEGEILVKLIGQIPVGWTYHIITTNEDIQYTSILNDTAEDVITALATAAVTAGFTEVHNFEELFLTKTGESLQMVKVDVANTNRVVFTNVNVTYNTVANELRISVADTNAPLFAASPIIEFTNSPYPLNTSYNIVSATATAGIVYVVVENFPAVGVASLAADITIFPSDTIGELPVTDSFAYDWSSSYAFGVEYFDTKGRTMGVVTQRAMSVQTPSYADGGSTLDVFLPQINIEISHRPPIEAEYFHLVRTKNLTKSDFLQWISNATYKDDEYAYISIEILNQYIKVNPQSNFLAWDFTAGDRIRFMRLLSSGVAQGTKYADKDYEIQANLSSPFVNGVQIEGQVFKIALPTTSSNFDFGAEPFDNYLIEVYTPAKSVGDGLDVYYEFGERYMIGDAGLPTRFHQGMVQNQTTDLSEPATFELVQGDNYFAQRTLNVGGIAQYSIDKTESPIDEGVPITLISGYDTQNYTVIPGEMPTGANYPYFLRILQGTYTFKISGSITVRLPSDGSTLDRVELKLIAFGGSIDAPLFTGLAPFADNQEITIPFSLVFPANDLNGGYVILNVYAIRGGSPVYLDILKGYFNLEQQGDTYTIGLQNPNYSFFYESEANSNGRPWVVNPDGRQNYNMVLMRYGQAYQQDTNINGTNRFFASQLDEYARSKGDIRRFRFLQRQLRVYQATGVGIVGIYTQFITNSNGQTQLIYTDQIITQNNIQYYVGEHGMGRMNSSLVSARNVDYFINPITGDWMRVSNDGMTSVSDLYKGQFYISSLFVPYNYVWDRPDGSIAKVIGAYDYKDEQCVYILQSGSRFDYGRPLFISYESNDGGNYNVSLGGNPAVGDKVSVTLTDGTNTATYTYEIGDGDAEEIILGLISLINDGGIFAAIYDDSHAGGDAGLLALAEGETVTGSMSIEYSSAITIDSYALSFNEKRNSFCSFYDFNAAENIVSVQNIITTFLNGNLFTHNNTNAYCNFFGVQYSGSIKLDFNGGEYQKKTFISLAYQANGVWTAAADDDITTQLDTFGTTPQNSKLVRANFKKLENQWHSSFLRAINSRGGWINGSTLKGGFLIINLSSPTDGKFYFLNEIAVKSIPSQLTNT
jgi:hypothetical protein